MSTQIVTLDSPTAITLPEETATAFGLHRGSRVAVTIKEDGILLQPLLADDLHHLRGIFSSDTDLVAELQQERRKDKW
jgi:bifunctional DNA-binding transcriptional regulator/antitoxin component of YhaV-PrlF toxin-antitoxin module